MTELTYDYAGQSALHQAAGRSDLDLATSGGLTPEGRVAHPHFFSGFVEHPPAVAAALLVLARVARTRFYVPPGMVAAILRAADPVVTSSDEGLRFESFSACCGVYARLDLDAASLDAEHLGVGVTNVDFNPPVRQALSGLSAVDPLHLSVGHDHVRVRTLDHDVVEEKVKLPSRWLRSFAETQSILAGMEPRLDVDRLGATRLIQALPRNSATKSVSWVTPTGRGHRLATRPTPGSVCLAGPERLRVLEPMLRHATRLRAWCAPVDATSTPRASAWTLDIPGGRISVVLSPDKSRGFSGEGATLDDLRRGQVEADADLISALLAFEPRIDVAALAAGAGLGSDQVLGALSLLAASGQVGYDLHAGAYFHRPLPMIDGVLEAHHPRLVKARELAQAGAVELVAPGLAQVTSKDTRHEVRMNETESCSCPWYARHKLDRGPCAHILAVRITKEER